MSNPGRKKETSPNLSTWETGSEKKLVCTVELGPADSHPTANLTSQQPPSNLREKKRNVYTEYQIRASIGICYMSFNSEPSPQPLVAASSSL